MLKLRGRVTKPEAYIRAYRKALSNAATVEDARRGKGLCVRQRIRFTEEEKKSWHFQELAKTRTPRIETPFGETQSVFEFDLNSLDDTKLWLEHCHRAGWHNAEVDGPGKV